MSASHPKKLVIATRASRLALWQARHVQARLLALYPQCQVELLEMTTRGDQILDRTLSKVGGKGLFIKELETALLDGRADLAVHSLKDVPVDMQQPFALAAVLERADPHDALVSNTVSSLGELAAGAVVGTSSLRREAQLRTRYPHLEVKPLRGNLDTRLAKLDRGDYSAIVLAAAGLQRLGLAERIRAILPADLSLPAAGQGALGIETLDSRTDLQQWLAPLASPETTACTLAERAVSKALGGSCQVPLAAYAVIDEGQLYLRALVAEPDGSRVLQAGIRGAVAQAESLGVTVAQDLLGQGADDILSRLSVS
ncbi:hydroxymethylbilane synthase [Castellaniella sp.]|uniref:hydroxymethylbilane synthase n=1 Tax=Castellaniella sp. TaxID=1955812 RepID=UPI003C70B0C5